MLQHILIPVALDHEEFVPRKIELARHLLSEGGQISLLTVLEDVPGFVSEFVDLKPVNHLTQKIKSRLDAVAGDADDVTTHVVTGKSGVRISEFARENKVDLIVVGSHHPSAQDYFLGSTASRVARRAPCSVYIMR
ncbi:universal stress protein [Hoeflea sp.]|uniref:universal stress protein n=1 Tax=Hoeflea sp. TaxID=1940281 RepID=UPI003B019C4D